MPRSPQIQTCKISRNVAAKDVALDLKLKEDATLQSSEVFVDVFTWSFIDTVRRELRSEWSPESQRQATKRNLSVMPALESRGIIANWTDDESGEAGIWTFSSSCLELMYLSDFKVDDKRIKRTLVENSLIFKKSSLAPEAPIDASELLDIERRLPEMMRSYGALLGWCADRQLKFRNTETAILHFIVTARGSKLGCGAMGQLYTFMPDPRLHEVASSVGELESPLTGKV